MTTTGAYRDARDARIAELTVENERLAHEVETLHRKYARSRRAPPPQVAALAFISTDEMLIWAMRSRSGNMIGGAVDEQSKKMQKDADDRYEYHETTSEMDQGHHAVSPRGSGWELVEEIKFSSMAVYRWKRRKKRHAQ